MPSIPHILIAEDHDAVRELLTTFVARMYVPCTITAVANGAEALAAYNNHAADLLITDDTMPKITGLALIRILRAQQATLPIVLVSMDGNISRTALATGANRFLAKPFEPDELQQILRDLLPAVRDPTQ